MDKHPGGQSIPIKTRDLGDVTALFQSYHAVSNKASMEESLNKYIYECSSNTSEGYDFNTCSRLIDLIEDQQEY